MLNSVDKQCPHFSKARFRPICFYESLAIVPVFVDKKKYENTGAFRKKGESNGQHSACREPLRRRRQPSRSVAGPLLPPRGSISASGAAPPRLCVPASSQVCAFAGKTCPKLVASPLCDILAYESSHRNALLAESGGNPSSNGF